MPDLVQLRELYTWMRSERVLYARCGELELRLEPAPPPVNQAPADTQSPEDEERRSLEELLYSSGADPSAILHLMKKVA